MSDAVAKCIGAYYGQAWKKYLFPCKQSKMSLQIDKISLQYDNISQHFLSQNFLARRFPICRFFYRPDSHLVVCNKVFTVKVLTKWEAHMFLLDYHFQMVL